MENKRERTNICKKESSIENLAKRRKEMFEEIMTASMILLL